MTCEVCDILSVKAADDERLVLQSEYWRVELDKNQQVLGKAFVTLLDHKANLSAMTKEEWADFATVVKRMEVAANALFEPSHFNWLCLMNDAVKKGEQTHVHWHFQPRYTHPVTIDGDTFEDRIREKVDHIVSHDTFMLLTQSLKGAM